MNPDMGARSRLEKQPTDLRRHHHYLRDGTLDTRPTPTAAQLARPNPLRKKTIPHEIRARRRF
jgi:hypothetical protein